MDEATLRVVDGLTKTDRVLFQAALGRFLADLRAVEAAANTTILCPGTWGAARARLAYALQ